MGHFEGLILSLNKFLAKKKTGWEVDGVTSLFEASFCLGQSDSSVSQKLPLRLPAGNKEPGLAGGDKASKNERRRVKS